MRITKSLAVFAAALALTASLTGCQLAAQTANSVIDQARQHELSENQPATPTAPSIEGHGPTVQVLRVIDGDTIAVVPSEVFPATNDTGTEHTIRLLGIDTPELNKMSDKPAECGAQAALDHLAKLLRSGDQVTVLFDQRADQTDRYGRSLAYLQLADGADVALSMVLDGYAAAWYPRGEPEPERYLAYADAQQAAASSNAGVHATCDSIGR
jgi:micrococcal nuclease